MYAIAVRHAVWCKRLLARSALTIGVARSKGTQYFWKIHAHAPRQAPLAVGIKLGRRSDHVLEFLLAIRGWLATREFKTGAI